MKKKLVAMLLVGAMALSSTACGSTPKNEGKSATSTDQSSDDGEELKAEKNLLSVEVTLPASLVKDGEAELDEEAKEAGVKEITKNEDGSITMKMTKEAHKDLGIMTAELQKKFISTSQRNQKISETNS